jgi:hypothetical protein
MKPCNLLAVTTVLSVAVFFNAVNASPSWTYVGLKGETIHTVFHLTGYSEDGVMAGTGTGIWNFEYARWIKAWSGLPVHDIKMTSGGLLLAAAGNGSDSDGVYVGRVAGIAEPGTIWRFSLLVKCSQPTALAFESIPGLDTACSGRVYVGNSSGVRCGYLCSGPDNNPVCALKEIAAPADPFGKTCKSMVVGTDDRKLYAGGYDDNLLNGLELFKPAKLIRGDAVGLSSIKTLNVTSIIEMPVQKEGDKRDIYHKAVATIDSGIQVFDGATLWSRYPSPAPGKPVLSIVPFRTIASMKWTEIVAATDTGVFHQCPPNADCVWVQMPGLHGSPKCLAQYGGKTLWAGTDSGVYRCDFPVGTGQNRLTTEFPGRETNSLRIRYFSGSISVGYALGSSSPVRLSVYNQRGQMVRKQSATRQSAGMHSMEISIKALPPGTYVVELAADKCRIAKKVAVP